MTILNDYLIQHYFILILLLVVEIMVGRSRDECLSRFASLKKNLRVGMWSVKEDMVCCFSHLPVFHHSIELLVITLVSFIELTIGM